MNRSLHVRRRIQALAFMLGTLIGYWVNERAYAVDPPFQDKGHSTYVAPAFAPPQAPQFCGRDGGGACTLTFSAGQCLRIAANGTWSYQIGAFDTQADGTSTINMATGAQALAGDGGACKYTDAGSCVFPSLSPLFDGNIEGWCLLGGQTKLSAITVDGGVLAVSPRYP